MLVICDIVKLRATAVKLWRLGSFQSSWLTAAIMEWDCPTDRCRLSLAVICRLIAPLRQMENLDTLCYRLRVSLRLDQVVRSADDGVGAKRLWRMNRLIFSSSDPWII